MADSAFDAANALGGDRPPSAPAVRELVGLYKSAGPELRSYLVVAICSSRIRDEAKQAFVEGMAKVERWEASLQETQELAGGMTSYVITDGGEGFHDVVGRYIELAGGAEGTEIEATFTVAIAVEGIVISGKLAASLLLPLPPPASARNQTHIARLRALTLCYKGAPGSWPASPSRPRGGAATRRRSCSSSAWRTPCARARTSPRRSSGLFRCC